MWVERGVFGGERYERDSVIIFDMGMCGCMRGIMIGLGFDRGVWFYCVCWDEVDNALRKGRGFTKNVNRGYVYKYNNS